VAAGAGHERAEIKYMATTLSLVEKGWENWSPEEWERYYWLNSYDRRRRILAPLKPCKRCGGKAVFQQNTIDMPYHNMLALGCQKCGKWLETNLYLRMEHLSGFGSESVIAAVVLTCRAPYYLVREWNHANEN
jgi:hypothetical protein